jgi:hypothetical protein
LACSVSWLLVKSLASNTPGPESSSLQKGDNNLY